ncbi:MAG: hypothetical protein U1F40_03855 [Turneriella sp.]
MKLMKKTFLTIVGLVAINCTKSFEYTIKITGPKATTTSTFEDANIVADFSLFDQAVAVKIKNKTGSAIQVNWDNVSFVDINGKSNRVIHTGIRLMERDKPQAPSIIPPGASLDDEITPVDNIRFESGQYGGWRTDPLMPPLDENQQKYVGKTLSVFMPLEINGKKKEYNFKIEITGIKERQPG